MNNQGLPLRIRLWSSIMSIEMLNIAKLTSLTTRFVGLHQVLANAVCINLLWMSFFVTNFSNMLILIDYFSSWISSCSYKIKSDSWLWSRFDFETLKFLDFSWDFARIYKFGRFNYDIEGMLRWFKVWLRLWICSWTCDFDMKLSIP